MNHTSTNKYNNELKALATDIACAFQWDYLALSDNVEVDLYRYRISVDTAMKLSSGTSVCPLFRLVGKTGHTGVRCLKAMGRKNVCMLLDCEISLIQDKILQTNFYNVILRNVVFRSVMHCSLYFVVLHRALLCSDILRNASPGYAS